MGLLASVSPRARRLDAVTLAGLLVLIYFGKRFYAAAGTAELAFVLKPTALMAGWLVGGRFEHEIGYGFVDEGLRFAIVPACAGGNFLLVAFAVLVTTLTLGELGTARRFTRLLAAAAWAYLATIAANAVRIALAVAWHVGQPELGWLTEARWHRIEGVAVYVAALLAAHELAVVWRRRRQREAA